MKQLKNIFLSNDKNERLYSINAIKSKSLEKERLQSFLWLKKWKKNFVLWFIWEITSKNFWNDFLETLKVILNLDIQILILAKAEKEFQDKIWDLYTDFKNNFLVLPENEENLRNIYAISDSILFLWVDDKKILSALSYWVVPILLNSENLELELLKDFDPLKEKWNSFFINWENYAFFLEAILRAKETFRFSYDWWVLRTHCFWTFEKIEIE